MVGFPTEGDEEFDNTVRVAKELPFAYCHVFSFSPRPGTPAARMKDTVPVSTIRQRSRTLASISRLKNSAYHQRHIGRTVRVLFEKGARAGVYIGLTDNFLRVGMAAQENPAGTVQDVTITGVSDGFAIGRPSTATSSPLFVMNR
jgi:threonylcarbamoyladenosine tRNA methylthiotransferase MtaB